MSLTSQLRDKNNPVRHFFPEFEKKGGTKDTAAFPARNISAFRNLAHWRHRDPAAPTRPPASAVLSRQDCSAPGVYLLPPERHSTGISIEAADSLLFLLGILE